MKRVQRISRRLDELGIPFVVVGGIAMFHHGFRRFTEDVDLLVTATIWYASMSIWMDLDLCGHSPPAKTCATPSTA